MSKVKPEYVSEIPYVPVNWEDRDTITRRILDILEAVMPEGQQLDRTKNLVKESTKQYFIEMFNLAYETLKGEGDGYDPDMSDIKDYVEAIWDKRLALKPGPETSQNE